MLGRVHSQLFNLVLESQLATLQRYDLQVVHGWMVHRFVELTLDVAMFALKLFKMGSKRHDWFSLSWFPRCTAQACPPQTALCDGTMTVCHPRSAMSNKVW
ncbi:protein of unknown function [Aminobacter niigataensis]|nr:protein of unknown function [Aminobacter niigataensis]